MTGSLKKITEQYSHSQHFSWLSCFQSRILKKFLSNHISRHVLPGWKKSALMPSELLVLVLWEPKMNNNEMVSLTSQILSWSQLGLLAGLQLCWCFVQIVQFDWMTFSFLHCFSWADILSQKLIKTYAINTTGQSRLTALAWVETEKDWNSQITLKNIGNHVVSSHTPVLPPPNWGHIQQSTCHFYLPWIYHNSFNLYDRTLSHTLLWVTVSQHRHGTCLTAEGTSTPCFGHPADRMCSLKFPQWFGMEPLPGDLHVSEVTLKSVWKHSCRKTFFTANKTSLYYITRTRLVCYTQTRSREETQLSI